MKKYLILLLSLGLFGCSAFVDKAVHVGPDPIPAGIGFRGVGHINGDFDFQTFADMIPTSALVKGHGDAIVTLRAYPPPFLVIDGDAHVIVEPLPGKEKEALEAVRLGHILIRREGVTGDLNPVGSIKAPVGQPGAFPAPASDPAPAGPVAPPPAPAAPEAPGKSEPPAGPAALIPASFRFPANSSCEGNNCCVPGPCR